jgi:hypothetical protein
MEIVIVVNGRGDQAVFIEGNLKSFVDGEAEAWPHPQ